MLNRIFRNSLILIVHHSYIRGCARRNIGNTSSDCFLSVNIINMPPPQLTCLSDYCIYLNYVSIAKKIYFSIKSFIIGKYNNNGNKNNVKN